MDIKLLADALTALLAPAMPYLVSGGGELVQEAGRKLGEGGLDLLKTLWGKLRPRVEEKPAAVEAIHDVALLARLGVLALLAGAKGIES